jgi:alpha-amylase/alpha-mannosidase (GH57 family)
MYLNFVWHFHQPIYHLPDSQYYLLPWVNYHITRDYWQMLKIIDEAEFPCTINLVPCLIEQVMDYAEGRAEDWVLDFLKKSDGQLSQEKTWRLKKLFPQFSAAGSESELKQFVLNFFFSPLLRPVEKSQEELLYLRENILTGFLDYFKKLAERKLLEMTVSPYHHPLLPLLADLNQASLEAPDLPDFRHPEDAIWQLKHSREYFNQNFGHFPAGLWPSEGALSQAACQLIAEAGFKFTMTDEHLLWKSLDQRPDLNLLYKPYDCAGIKILFRDRELSDLIGFEYHRWPAGRAVADFLRRLELRTRKVPEGAICSIILDGENPWGAYRNNGVDFLRLLFEKIKASSSLKPVLPGDYLKSRQPEQSLEIVSGTWMSNFFKWVGHPDKVQAWKRLAAQREKHPFSSYMAVAEGSDWFWWAGESEEKEFDLLFTSYLDRAGLPKKLIRE